MLVVFFITWKVWWYRNLYSYGFLWCFFWVAHEFGRTTTFLHPLNLNWLQQHDIIRKEIWKVMIPIPSLFRGVLCFLGGGYLPGKAVPTCSSFHVWRWTHWFLGVWFCDFSAPRYVSPKILLKCFDFGCQFSFKMWHVNLDFSITPPKNQHHNGKIIIFKGDTSSFMAVFHCFSMVTLVSETSSTLGPCYFFRPSNHRRLGSIKHKFRHMFVISGSRGGWGPRGSWEHPRIHLLFNVAPGIDGLCYFFPLFYKMKTWNQPTGGQCFLQKKALKLAASLPEWQSNSCLRLRRPYYLYREHW